MTTRSPSPTAETLSPVWTTVPVISWPVTIGILRPVRALGVSQEMNTGPYRYSSMSVAQIPQ